MKERHMSDPRVDQAKGDIKTAAGKATGDRDLEAAGRTESATAGLRKGADRAMDTTRDVVDDVVDRGREVADDVADKTSDAAHRAADQVGRATSR
jgi:uncharacterized protein YjbJ (UPF0337 family)